MILFPAQIIGLFTSEPDVISIGIILQQTQGKGPHLGIGGFEDDAKSLLVTFC